MIVKKAIKFDLAIDGVKVKTVEELREHITVELIEHFKSGLLLKWLLQRDLELAEQFKQINPNQNERKLFVDIVTGLGEIELDEQIIDALFEIPVKTKPNIQDIKIQSSNPKIAMLQIPDIGGSTNVNVAEVYVKVGDKIDIDDNLLMLETDMATMEVPAEFAGVVTEVLVQVGSKVNEGDVIVKLNKNPIETNGKSPTTNAREIILTLLDLVKKLRKSPTTNAREITLMLKHAQLSLEKVLQQFRDYK